MIPLPVANILHHKLRSVLSALGVAIAVCMLVTLSGLSRGSLMEIADRWDSVDADLIVYNARWGDNITTASGAGVTAADARRIAELTVGDERAVRRVVPVFLYRLAIGGQEHNVAGVDPEDLDALLGGGEVLPPGRRFDPQGRFADWLRKRLLKPTDDDRTVEITDRELAEHGGLEMIVDARLAKAGGLSVGDKVASAGRDFTVVGIVPAGAMVRAFVPRATAEYLYNGPLDRFTLMFVKLREGVRPGAAAEAIRGQRRLTAAPLDEYRSMLIDRFGIMFVYIHIVNAVVLLVAFLFILVTLFTMVIQRTREIAILKSMGATWQAIVAGIVCESLLLTLLGAAAGALAAPAAGAAIEAWGPLLTVEIGWEWIAVATGAAVLGGMLAAIYPAYCALRVDVLAALTLE